MSRYTFTITMTHRNYLLIAFLLFVVPSCAAQTQFPDTPAGVQAKAWLEVFNAGDAEKLKDFLRKNAPTRLDRAIVKCASEK